MSKLKKHMQEQGEAIQAELDEVLRRHNVPGTMTSFTVRGESECTPPRTWQTQAVTMPGGRRVTMRVCV